MQWSFSRNKKRKMVQWEHTQQGDWPPTVGLGIHPVPEVGSTHCSDTRLTQYPPLQHPLRDGYQQYIQVWCGVAFKNVDTRRHFTSSPCPLGRVVWGHYTSHVACRIESRALHFVPLGAHLVYIGHPFRPNGRPWAQNVGPWLRAPSRNLLRIILSTTMNWWTITFFPLSFFSSACLAINIRGCTHLLRKWRMENEEEEEPIR